MVGGVGVVIVTDEEFEVGTVALLLLLLLPLLLFPQLLTAKAISDIRTRLIDRMITPMIYSVGGKLNLKKFHALKYLCCHK